MMAYRAAGIGIARTSQGAVGIRAADAWDLVFFVGSDGIVTSPVHVGLVIGNGKMIEA